MMYLSPSSFFPFYPVYLLTRYTCPACRVPAFTFMSCYLYVFFCIYHSVKHMQGFKVNISKLPELTTMALRETHFSFSCSYNFSFNILGV